MRLQQVLVLSALLMMSTRAHARDVYVDATLGDDSSGNGTASLPWRTFTHALGQGLTSGDHVWAAAGVYGDTGSSGSEVWPLLLPEGVSLHGADAAPAATILRSTGSGPVIRLQTGAVLAVLWLVERLHLEGPARAPGSVGIALDPGKGQGPVIRANRIAGFEHGVSENAISVPAGADSRAFLDGNVIRDNAIGLRFALNLATPASRVRERTELLNNWIENNDVGIELVARCTGCGTADLQLTPVIVNNTVADNTGDGIRMTGGDCAGTVELAADLTNDIVAFNGGKGIAAELCAQPKQVLTSLFWQNAGGDGAVPPNLFVDPLLVNRAGLDYHLAAGSPCIDAGTDPVDVATDIDSGARPVDGNGDLIAQTDIGADEYRSAAGANLRRASFAAYDPPSPARGSVFPFAAGNPLTPVVRPDFVSDDSDPTAGILTDPRVPMAFWQIEPLRGTELLAVKDLAMGSVRFTVR